MLEEKSGHLALRLKKEHKKRESEIQGARACLFFHQAHRIHLQNARWVASVLASDAKKRCSGACRPCASRRRGACLWAIGAARSRPRGSLLAGGLKSSGRTKRNAKVKLELFMLTCPGSIGSAHVTQQKEIECCARSVLLCVVQVFRSGTNSDDVEGAQAWPQRLPEGPSILFMHLWGQILLFGPVHFFAPFFV